MDGSTKIKLPSMKTAEFMDGNFIQETVQTIFSGLTSTDA